MRTYTLTVSMIVHVAIVAAIVLAPVLVNGMLPAPRTAISFIAAQPIEPPSPPAIRGRSSGTSARNARAAPVVAGSHIAPESNLERFEPAGDGAGMPDGVPFGLPDGGVGDAIVPPPPQPVEPPTPMPVGGSIRRPQKIHHVAPAYPQVALAARIHGTVILEAVIGEDGRVRSLRVLRSVAMLDDAAMNAVRQWRFTPTLLNGQPVPVVMTVTVTFSLGP